MGNMTVTQMVADCKLRFPIRLSTSFWEDRLNEAYRWICQQGAFPWNLTLASVTSDASGNFTLPNDFSPGKLAFIYKGDVRIDYLPIDEALTHADYGVAPATYSCWSYYLNSAMTPVTFKGILFPDAARAADTLSIIYHANPSATAFSGAVAFPTPPEFDSTMMELAESEARRRYRDPMFDVPQKRAQESAKIMLQNYRTTKKQTIGVAEQTLRVQDDKAEDMS